MIVRSRDRASPFSQERRKEFEYDPEEFCYSDDAQKHIEHLMMMNYSFSVDFVTDGTLRAAQVSNDILLRVSGYKPLHDGDASRNE